MKPFAQTLTTVRLVAIALALAGVVLMVVLVGSDALPVAAAWLAGSAALAVVWALVRARWARIGVAVVAIAACVLLGWEGGLFMLPAAIALLVESLLGRRGPAVAPPPLEVSSR